MKKIFPLLVLVPFSLFSTAAAVEGGLTGISSLLRSPWGLQVTLDLCISIFLVGAWIRRDARAHGISATPYLLALPFLGSIGALLYLVRRNFGARGAETARASS